MWVLLSTRLRTWLLTAALLPVLRLGARQGAQVIERRHGGPTGVSRLLRRLSVPISGRGRTVGGPGAGDQR